MKTTAQALTLLVLFFGCHTAANASIYVDVGSKVTFGNGPGTDAGRFFATGTNSSGDALTPFDTFCTETGVNQFINFTDTYKVVAIGTQTSGEPGDPSTIRTLTPLVAWAYTQFRSQNLDATYGLAGFDFDTATTNSSRDSANSLQNLIWGNLNLPYAGTVISAARTLWEANFANATAAYGSDPNDPNGWDPTSLGNVRIMQLTSLDGKVTKQDQVVMIPVPEATSLAIWSLLTAVGAMGLVYRRK